MRRIVVSLVSAFAAVAATGPLASAEPSHGIAMHGQPALQADFPHFPYVNPDAPKGGRIDYAVQGTFDSLNPFIVQGDASRGLFDAAFGNTTFDTLMMRSRDEAFSLYPLLAAHARRLAEIARGGALFAAVTDAPDSLLSTRARAEMVAALAVVDYVILDGQPPEALAGLIEADSVLHEETEDQQRTQELTRHVHDRQR